MGKYANKVVEQAKAWLGLKESDGSFKPIIDIYNSHKPPARGYALKYTDAWCAGFVSAVAIKVGYTDIIPTEVSCSKMIELFKGFGTWVENENRTPNPGDIIFYDWDDSGTGDNKGNSDHVGIVEKASGGKITVIEGNYSNAVGRRTLDVNGRYIRGYGVPKYDSEEAEKNAAATPPDDAKKIMFTKEQILAALGDQYIETFDDLPEWAKPEMREILDGGYINGGTTADKNPDDINMRLENVRNCLVCYRMIKGMM